MKALLIVKLILFFYYKIFNNKKSTFMGICMHACIYTYICINYQFPKQVKTPNQKKKKINKLHNRVLIDFHSIHRA